MIAPIYSRETPNVFTYWYDDGVCLSGRYVHCAKTVQDRSMVRKAVEEELWAKISTSRLPFSMPETHPMPPQLVGQIESGIIGH